MSMHRFVGLALLLPAFVVACGGGSADDGSGGLDGEDSASADSIAGGAARARDFTTPNLSASEQAHILASYTRVDPQHTIAPNLLRDALVYYDLNKAHIPNKGHLAVVDFKLNSGKKRFYLIDMESGAVTPHDVAHGSGSEDGHGNSVRFSNVDGTHESSLGFVLTGETFSGKHGRSLRLDGLSSTNSNMRSRAIIIHSADYVHEGSSRQGNSWGCFALDSAVKDTVVDMMKDGALLYANLGDPNAPPLPTTDPGSSDDSTGSSDTSGGDAPQTPPDDPGTGSGATSCSSDGDCNPSDDGAGMICENSECVPGCHSSPQCPGSKICSDGQCK